MTKYHTIWRKLENRSGGSWDDWSSRYHLEIRNKKLMQAKHIARGSCMPRVLIRITQKPHGRTSPNFYACCLWPWLGPPLAALWYVMYFRFYGWRHILITWTQWAESSTTLCLEEVCQGAVPVGCQDHISGWSSSLECGTGVKVCYLRLS